MLLILFFCAMKNIHLIAIGGAVMHNLALELSQLGYQVSGSDDDIFEPSKSRLKEKGLLPDQMGWFPDKITNQIDLIILGMHARKDNPELLKAQELGIKIMSFPEFIYEHSKNKKRIVIAGSHGKTTTTAMLMHVFKELKIDFDYLVGSQITGYQYMVRLSNAPYIIIEGDEYLTSPLDPKPKFLWYKPHYAIITGIAWDHINVFPTLEIYNHQFKLFLDSMEPKAPLVWYSGDTTLQNLMQNSNLKSIPYQELKSENIDNTCYLIKDDGSKIKSKLFGQHNLQNMSAVLNLSLEMGFNSDEIYNALASFTGTARRLELIQEKKNVLVYRDFAHSPSKLKATLNAVINQFKSAQIIPVYELHTFSSLNENFLNEYKGSMDSASQAIVFFNPAVFEWKKMPALNPEKVKEAFGPNTIIINNSEELKELINSSIIADKLNVILLMSSGNFDNMNLEF